MQANPSSELKESNEASAGVSAEVRETAVRLGALQRHLFAFDNGKQLRAMEDSGLNFTQIKMLTMLGSNEEGQGCPGGALAETTGLSMPTVSRAVDTLVEKGLVTRVEDADDRRVRRIAITQDGVDVISRVMTARLSGLIAFSAGLSDKEREKLDDALDTLMQREELMKGYKLIDSLEAR